MRSSGANIYTFARTLYDATDGAHREEASNTHGEKLFWRKESSKRRITRSKSEAIVEEKIIISVVEQEQEKKSK